MKLDGSDVRRLTDFGAMSWAPYFHPSGQYVIYTANKLGFANFELFLVDALGAKEPVRVTYTDGFDGLPVFSPTARSSPGPAAARRRRTRKSSWRTGITPGRWRRWTKPTSALALRRRQFIAAKSRASHPREVY